MAETPNISRALVLKTIDGQYGLEVVFDNPTNDVIWVDHIDFEGEVNQHISFQIDKPFFHALTYKIDMACELIVSTEQQSKYQIEANVFEDKNADWSYPAKGEFNYESPGGAGKLWQYKITFPVLVGVESKGRSAIRLLFSEPFKNIIRNEHKGGGPGGMYISHTSSDCKLRAVTNDGYTIEKEMDDSFLTFIANRGVEDKKTRKESEAKSTGDEIIRIVFMASDPTDASRLRLGEEAREIQEKLQLAKLRDKFSFHQKMSVRPSDISQALLDINPSIVHFSGHGTKEGELCFEDTSGYTHPINSDALADLFEQFSGQLSCVLLNACYSSGQAKAIAEHIDYVIGMSQEIGDKAAIFFAIGFYQAIGAGRTIEDAFKLGCIQLKLQNIPEHLTPVLLMKSEQIHA